MISISGITVKLINLVEVGKDDFNHPIYEESETLVDNVLVSPSSQTEIIESFNLYGKKSVYTLAIPKGDEHQWEDSYVEFFGERFHVYTPVAKGIDKLIPLQWNAKVLVERYE